MLHFIDFQSAVLHGPMVSSATDSLMSMYTFGQNDIWNLSTVKLLILVSIKLVRVIGCPKDRRLSHRKFLSCGNA